MPRTALPLVLAAFLAVPPAGRAVAQSPDSLGRGLDSLASQAMRRADSLSRAGAEGAEAHARWADSVSRPSVPFRRARWEDSLRFGRRVRIATARRGLPDSLAARREGVFISLARDSVVYRAEDGDSIHAVSLRDVRGLWVSEGRLTRGQHAVMTALAAGALSSMALMVTYRPEPSRDGVRAGSARIGGAFVAGAGVGWLVGLASGTRERWHRVWPPGD
jgi:hypothetical protein